MGLLGAVQQRAKFGIGGILTALYGLLELFIIGVLTALISTWMLELPEYDSSEELKTFRNLMIAGSFFLFLLWLLASVLSGITFFSSGIPYLNLILAILNFLITLPILIISALLITKLPQPTEANTTIVSRIRNVLIGIIIYISISWIILFIYGIWAAKTYKPRQDLELISTAASFVPGGQVVSAGIEGALTGYDLLSSIESSPM